MRRRCCRRRRALLCHTENVVAVKIYFDLIAGTEKPVAALDAVHLAFTRI